MSDIEINRIMEINRLRAENEKLRAALRPFAEAAEDLDEDELPWSILDWWNKELAAAAAYLGEKDD